MNFDEVKDTTLRYTFLVLVAVFGIGLFYKIFTPLTVYPVFYVLEKLYNAQLLEGNVIFFKGYYAQIIPACVAGAAYFLLFSLNLATPMHFNKRIKSLTFLAFSFLLINILRIIVFAIIIFVGYQYFDIAHMLAWYVGSTVIVVAVWFANVWLFNIHAIPIYTDALKLFQDIYKDKGRSKDVKI